MTKLAARSHPASPSVSSNTETESTVVRSTEVFAMLKQEWDELYDDCPRATPFQSWAWLYSWWEAYGNEYFLKLVTVRRIEDSLLVGIVPLMSERKSPWRILFIGTGLSDYLDVLVREGFEEEAAKAGCEAVAGLCRWRIADLQQLRPRAAAWEVFGRWDGFEMRIWQESCPVVELKPWENLVASLSRNNRSVVRRNIKRAVADGVSRDLAGVERAEEAASTLVALHRETWKDGGITPNHLSERFESCLRAAARRMTAQGLGAVSEFRSREGEVIGGDFLIFSKDSIGSYVQGASQAALKQYQLSSLYIWDAVNLNHDGRFAYFDWMRGQEEYKLRWKPTVLPSDRLILGRAPLPWAAYAAYQTLRSRAKFYVCSGEAPERAVTAAKRLNLAAKKLKEWKTGSRRQIHAHGGEPK